MVGTGRARWCMVRVVVGGPGEDSVVAANFESECGGKNQSWNGNNLQGGHSIAWRCMAFDGCSSSKLEERGERQRQRRGEEEDGG